MAPWFDRGSTALQVDAIQFAGKAPGLPDGPVSATESAMDTSGHNWNRSFWLSGYTFGATGGVVDEYERRHPGRTSSSSSARRGRRIDLLAPYVADDEFHQAFTFDLMMSLQRCSCGVADRRRSYIALARPR